VVGLQDMMFKAKQAADATREPFTFSSPWRRCTWC
jgi:arginine/ornithine transport system permease protein